MLSGAVTNRYTLGLYDFADAHGVVDKVNQSLHMLAITIDANPELKGLLEHPLIEVDAKMTAVKNIFGEQLEPVVLRFLHILFGRGRSAYVLNIAHRFRQLAEAAKGILTVQVESAQPLKEAQIQAIENQLSRVFNKQANAVVEVNPDLIAGYRVRVGNRVLDATVSGALGQFSEKLLAGGAIKEGTQ